MANESKYICLNCKAQSFDKYSTFWRCKNCQTQYASFRGMPKLVLENHIGEKDKSLRDYFYNGLLGKFYQSLMPFLTLPARPFKISKKDWLVYFISVLVFGVLVYRSIYFFIHLKQGVDYFGILSLILLTLVINFFVKHPYFLYLFLLAIPVKFSLKKDKYKPAEGFREVHKKNIDRFSHVKDRKLQVLDISTGTGNSLYRHGWMKLNAEYTGLDLSETMLAQCQDLMTVNKIPVDLVIGDATSLPFSDGYFDIVLNYGAINGYSDIGKALREMKRVVKADGLVLFLDEQLYSEASFIEKIYFRKVLSSHNVIHHCPIEFLPPNAGKVDVYQVYEFYYICTCSQ